MQYVAFLRAVNLGKRNAPAAVLVSTVEGLGYAGVRSYINSGNVIFEGSGTPAGHEARLQEAFEEALGFEATTFVRSAPQLRHAVSASPFELDPGDTYFVTFLKHKPDAKASRALEALSNDFDTLLVLDGDVHWRMRGRSTETTLPANKWAAIVGKNQSTSRNTTMLRKLVDKLDG